MIHYYFFKNVITNLDNDILEKLEFDDNLVFNLANFNNTPSFYSLFHITRNDKYKIQNYFDGMEFNSFIVECMINLQKNNNYKQLLFLYAMVTHRTLNDYLYPYVNALKSSDYSFTTAINMLDFYDAKRNGFDVTKDSIVKEFHDSFVYYDYMDELIRYPMVKAFKLMSSESYFKRCYRKKKTFYKKYAKVKYRMVLLKLWSLFFRKHGIIPTDFPYRKKIDTKLLNVKKDHYKIGEREYCDSLDEILKNALKDSLTIISAINSYLFDNNDQKIRKIYNIPEEKKL